MATVTVTEGHTGKNAKDIKTKITAVSPEEYLKTVEPERRIKHGELLFEIFNRVTKTEAVMWGPSMIGYGEVHYASSSGREGDWFKIGFSPRKAAISLYGLQETSEFQSLSPKLGKFRAGKGCLYINKPEDIDLEILESLIRAA